MNKHFTPLRALVPAVLLATGLVAPTAQAQTPDRKTAIGANVSLLQYHGNFGSDFGRLFSPAQVGVGAHISRYLSPSFDLSLLGNLQNYRFVRDNAPYREFNSRIGMVDLGLKLKLNNGHILREDFFLQPYLMGGGGLFAANSGGNYLTVTNAGVVTPGTFSNQMRVFEVFGAAGIRFRLSSVVSLDIQTSQHYPLTDRIDNVSNSNDKLYDRFLVHSAGLTFALGKAKDTDGDGVSDNKDKCPDTPAGVKVDATGCPLDTDGDGVADYQDKCPDVKGLAALQGCPDADGDGVADNDDKCPNTPAGVRVDASGCPVDSDGDGVADYQDKCPGTPAGVKVDATGCPLDRDGDGVPDFQDRCPDRAGPASNKGCPEIKAEAKKILNEATKYINFDFNKATLKPSSNTRLQQMVQIMNDYPDYSLSIAGHTDSKGADDYNLRLSYERAAAARKYMLSKGIPAERIEARGYGETKPIADNKTAAGQALNRRVDFDPYLTGETNAAEAKYGPAPSISELRATGQKLPGKKTTGTGAPRSRKAPVKKAPAKRK
ncbi:OmpA family protein [Hymenobacter sp. HMF4947]|uniref:OmpA family protein n=1 Tax=Hymenobacter ginkgonis TaxID=2682976 RepID=A0A7K1TJQ7_9BACT|nr:OmpA family protein [Hymenobacter ginkgonis]MVN78638.1 OmpA family protein [Hymenobacter ginkgonis]